jgi:hypothetical protein
MMVNSKTEVMKNMRESSTLICSKSFAIVTNSQEIELFYRSLMSKTSILTSFGFQFFSTASSKSLFAVNHNGLHAVINYHLQL